MKYFIGFLLKGEASEWHIDTTKKISDKFNTWKIYEKIPPHITIFYPEGIEDITNIRNYIKDWAEKNKSSGNFYISGFGRFDDKVVFANIDADEAVIKSVNNLREGLRNISEIISESFPVWQPHSTLANKLESEEINSIWKYVSEFDRPNFIIPFNNVTIFKFAENQKWVVDEYFELT